MLATSSSRLPASCVWTRQLCRRSLSLSGSRGKADVPHDFAAEAAWFAARAEDDPRLRIA